MTAPEPETCANPECGHSLSFHCYVARDGEAYRDDCSACPCPAFIPPKAEEPMTHDEWLRFVADEFASQGRSVSSNRTREAAALLAAERADAEFGRAVLKAWDAISASRRWDGKPLSPFFFGQRLRRLVREAAEARRALKEAGK